MIRRPNGLLLALMLLLAATAKAQDVLSTSLQRMADHYQPEKIHLHYDRTVYGPGDTIWFKAYALDDLLPAKSKTLYTDFITPDGKVLDHITSPMLQGQTNGQFILPTDYTSPVLHVRSYTKWNLNFDSALTYTRTLRIIQPPTKPSIPAPVQTTTVTLFPEGGEVIAGIPNRIAFKAHGITGLPVVVRGVVLADGKPQDSVFTEHDGMGSFLITPVAGKRYLVSLNDARGRKQSIELPQVQPAGVGMRVEVDGDRRIIHLQSSEEAPKNVVVVGTVNARIAFRLPVQLTNGTAIRRIVPVKDLPSGILRITLLDNDYTPLSERITYLNNNEFSFPATLEVERWGLNKRARNEIKVTVPAGAQQLMMSVSVTDAALPHDSSDNIISRLQVGSELYGYIHKPGYYFSDSSAKVASHLDLVMLTHGWRKFNWKALAQGTLPTFKMAKDTNYLFLSGKLFGVPNSVLSGTETLPLILRERDSVNTMMFLPISRDGSFGDSAFVFFDSLRVFYNVKSKLFQSGEARFMTSRLSVPDYRNWGILKQPSSFRDTVGMAYATRLSKQNLEYIKSLQGTVLENIVVEARKDPVQELEKRYVSSALFSSDDAIKFDLVNDPAAIGKPNIFYYLQGRVGGLQVNDVTTNGAALSWRGGTPTLYLNEMEVDAQWLSSVNVNDIAYIKVFRPPFIAATGGGAGGAIAIYTKKGEDLRTASGGLLKNAIIGYSKIREFYSPNHTIATRMEAGTDKRATLYWSPMSRPGKDGVMRFHFFNNDITNSFRIVIEGMTSDGLVMRHEEILE